MLCYNGDGGLPTRAEHKLSENSIVGVPTFQDVKKGEQSSTVTPHEVVESNHRLSYRLLITVHGVTGGGLFPPPHPRRFALP